MRELEIVAHDAPAPTSTPGGRRCVVAVHNRADIAARRAFVFEDEPNGPVR